MPMDQGPCAAVYGANVDQCPDAREIEFHSDFAPVVMLLDCGPVPLHDRAQPPGDALSVSFAAGVQGVEGIPINYGVQCPVGSDD